MSDNPTLHALGTVLTMLYGKPRQSPLVSDDEKVYGDSYAWTETPYWYTVTLDEDGDMDNLTLFVDETKSTEHEFCSHVYKWLNEISVTEHLFDTRGFENLQDKCDSQTVLYWVPNGRSMPIG